MQSPYSVPGAVLSALPKRVHSVQARPACRPGQPDTRSSNIRSTSRGHTASRWQSLALESGHDTMSPDKDRVPRGGMSHRVQGTVGTQWRKAAWRKGPWSCVMRKVRIRPGYMGQVFFRQRTKHVPRPRLRQIRASGPPWDGTGQDQTERERALGPSQNPPPVPLGGTLKHCRGEVPVLGCKEGFLAYDLRSRGTSSLHWKTGVITLPPRRVGARIKDIHTGS